MTAPGQEPQCVLFHEAPIGDHVPQDRVLRVIDRLVALCGTFLQFDRQAIG